MLHLDFFEFMCKVIKYMSGHVIVINHVSWLNVGHTHLINVLNYAFIAPGSTKQSSHYTSFLSRIIYIYVCISRKVMGY